MILDTSAIVGIVFQEPGWEGLLEALVAAGVRGIGTPTLTETGIVLGARLGRDSRPLLARFLQELDVTVVPFGEPHWREAVRAWNEFGKGRDAARLNFGDCLAYATARLASQPLLCKGGDFRQTDLELAFWSQAEDDPVG